MADTWQAKYHELKNFIEANSSIQIDRHVMVIPDDVRPAFYRHFDVVRRQYIEDNFPSLLQAAATLGNKYIEARDALAEQLDLCSVETSPQVKWFLSNPVQGLMHFLADPLFDLVKGILTIDEFDDKAQFLLEKTGKNLLHHGYRHWVLLSLVRLTSPDKAYQVPLPDQMSEPELNDAETIPGMNVHEMPDIKDTVSIQLDFSPYVPFIAPNVVVHSNALNAFAGIRGGYNNVFRRAKALSKRVEWINMNNVRRWFGTSNLWPDIGIYESSTKERLKILADYYLAARPAALAEVVATEQAENKVLETARRHRDILKPITGSYIICREPLSQTLETDNILAQPSAASTDISQPTNKDGDIKILVVGYDENKLQPIIDALKPLELAPPAEEWEDLEEIQHYKL